MKAIILRDLKSVIRSKRLWIAVGLIVLSSAINLTTIFLFEQDKPAGFLGVFIFADIRGNPMMNFLAPFIPAFVFGPLAAKELHKELALEQKTQIKRSLAAHSVSSVISGAAISIIAYIIVLIGCFIFDPTIQDIDYTAAGLFADVFSTCVPLYIVLFILYSALFGAVYSFFSLGIGLITRSLSMAMVLPGLIYQASHLIYGFVNNHVLSWIDLLLPSFTYQFNVVKTASPILGKVAGIGCIVIASIIMVAATYKKLKRTTDNSLNESMGKEQEM